jgi:hypothetical protein
MGGGFWLSGTSIGGASINGLLASVGAKVTIFGGEVKTGRIAAGGRKKTAFWQAGQLTSGKKWAIDRYLRLGHRVELRIYGSI